MADKTATEGFDLASERISKQETLLREMVAREPGPRGLTLAEVEAIRWLLKVSMRERGIKEYALREKIKCEKELARLRRALHRIGVEVEATRPKAPDVAHSPT